MYPSVLTVCQIWTIIGVLDWKNSLADVQCLHEQLDLYVGLFFRNLREFAGLLQLFRVRTDATGAPDYEELVPEGP